MANLENIGKKSLAAALSLALLCTSAFSPAWAVYSVPTSVGNANIGSSARVGAAGAGAQLLNIGQIQTSNVGSRLSLGGTLTGVENLQVAETRHEIAPQQLAPVVERHPVLNIVNDLQKAGIQIQNMPSSAEEYQALEDAIQRNVPEGRAKVNMLAFAKSLSMGGAGHSKMAEAFDGGMRDGKYVMPVTETASPTGFWNWMSHRKRGWFGLKKYAAEKTETQRRKAPLINKDALRVPIERLRWVPDAKDLPEKLTDLKGGKSGIVGQDRALKSIDFGLEMDDPRYNLIVTGADGTGRETALRYALAKLAPTKETPPDIVSATNFRDPSSPIMLTLAPGSGRAFQGAVRQVIGTLKQTLPQHLMSGPVAEKMEQMHEAVAQAKDEALAKFDAEVDKVKSGRYGIRFIDQGKGRFAVAVTIDGKAVTPEQLDAIIEKDANDDSVTDKVTMEKFEAVQKELGGEIKRFGKQLQSVMSQLAQMEGQVQQQMMQLQSQVVQQILQQVGQTLLPFTQDEAHAAFAKRALQRKMALDKEISEIVILEKFGLEINIDGGKLMAAPTWTDPAMAEKIKGMGPLAQALGLGGGAQAISEKEFNQLKEAGQLPADLTWKQLSAAVVAKAKEFLPKFQAMGKENQQDQESLPQPTPESRKVLAYVKSMLNHMGQAYPIFMPRQSDETNSEQEPITPEKLYKVSVLTSNKPGAGAPVIFEHNPSFQKLFGAANDASTIGQKNGMMIKMQTPGGPNLEAGSFIKANGGYLVLDMMTVLREPGVYQALMQMIRNGRAVISEGGAMSMVTQQGDQYEVPAKVKVILIGSPHLKMLLSSHDEDFAGLFRSVAEFEHSLEIGAEAMTGYLSFMRTMVEQSAGKIMDFAKGAISGVFEMAAQLAESNVEMTAQFGAMRGLMLEATYWAKKNGHDIVERTDLDQAVSERVERVGGMRERIKKMYTSDSFHIAIEGKEIGQINGLAVMGDFGVPARITFENRVRPGADFVVSADQIAHATGGSFDKSLANIKGFMGKLLGRNRTVPLEVSISFEQNYGGIDGDSATQTMIYGIISSLSDTPINQGIAITGSADQKGNVQVIGGVNHKIEGYFDVVTEKLKREGRTMEGKQGIIIPSGNVKDLMLRPDIVEAVRQGKFNIYAVDHISQGVELLMDTPYSEVLKKANERIDQVWASAKGK
ncbi:MAG: AAA family ATPase [Elusimicrobiota bacterium]